MEPCTGCGAIAPQHPIVGVARDRETGEMSAFPVCEPCWRDPAHRKAPLKMHFFPRDQERIAVASAGSPNLGS